MALILPRSFYKKGSFSLSFFLNLTLSIAENIIILEGEIFVYCFLHWLFIFHKTLIWLHQISIFLLQPIITFYWFMHLNSISKIIMKLMITFYHHLIVLTYFGMKNWETYFKSFPFIIYIYGFYQHFVFSFTWNFGC